MEAHMQYKQKLEAEWLEVKVRFSIFIIISACAGLPALVWSVSELIHHRKNGRRISVFIILLLLTDFVELFLSPYIILKYLLDEFPSVEDWKYLLFSSLWWSSRACGIILNQLVALEGFLSVKYSPYTACVFSKPCFRIFYILVFLCFFILAIISGPIFLVSIVLIVSVITWIIPCGASRSADHHSDTSRKPDYHILVVFMYTLLVLVLYLILELNILIFNLPLKLRFRFIPYFLTSVRLMSDPLLCVLVFRQKLSIQTSQTSEGTSLV